MDSPKPYNFKEQLAIGAQGEAFLDSFFHADYQIAPAHAFEQKQGIDRHFINRNNGTQLRVEYKTDGIAQKTHNAFVETTSVDKNDKAGWAYTSTADYLIYYVPGDELIYVIRLTKLRKCLPTWATKYPLKSALNEGYRTWGLIIPLREFERIADRVYSV